MFQEFFTPLYTEVELRKLLFVPSYRRRFGAYFRLRRAAQNCYIDPGEKDKYRNNDLVVDQESVMRRFSLQIQLIILYSFAS